MSSYADGIKKRTEEIKLYKSKQLKAKQEDDARNHRAWLRLCGSVSPIGGLSE